jgi:hypothetical protein
MQRLLHFIIERKADAVVEEQLRTLATRPARMNASDYKSAMQAKIRHLGGACVARLMYKVQVTKSLSEGNFLSKRILQQVVVTEQSIMTTTVYPDSLKETETLQCTKRTLININDKAFLILHNVVWAN